MRLKLVALYIISFAVAVNAGRTIFQDCAVLCNMGEMACTRKPGVSPPFPSTVDKCKMASKKCWYNCVERIMAGEAEGDFV